MEREGAFVLTSLVVKPDGPGGTPIRHPPPPRPSAELEQLKARSVSRPDFLSPPAPVRACADRADCAPVFPRRRRFCALFQRSHYTGEGECREKLKRLHLLCSSAGPCDRALIARTAGSHFSITRRCSFAGNTEPLICRTKDQAHLGSRSGNTRCRELATLIDRGKSDGGLQWAFLEKERQVI